MELLFSTRCIFLPVNRTENPKSQINNACPQCETETMGIASLSNGSIHCLGTHCVTCYHNFKSITHLNKVITYNICGAFRKCVNITQTYHFMMLFKKTKKNRVLDVTGHRVFVTCTSKFL